MHVKLKPSNYQFVRLSMEYTNDLHHKDSDDPYKYVNWKKMGELSLGRFTL